MMRSVYDANSLRSGLSLSRPVSTLADVHERAWLTGLAFITMEGLTR